MAQGDSFAGARPQVVLNGKWERYVHGKVIDAVAVPSSLRPYGIYRLQRNFLLPRLSRSERAILHFEGITYFGRAFVNGNELGTMTSYVPHEFDFTAHAKEGENTVEVSIADACPEADGSGKDDVSFGTTSGWECYGGIIREVWVEVRPSAYIDNIRFGYELNNQYSVASCAPQILIDSNIAQNASYELVLSFGHTESARLSGDVQLKAGLNEVPVHFDVAAPALWAPDEPNLYDLRAVVKTAGGEHHWQCRTGFREVKTRGNQFLLNGEPIVLRGICRMELWKDQGFTMQRRQHEQDMRGIKKMGANFVRLQPFPHHRNVIELADEIGLFVSEEAGFWNMDLLKMPKSEINLGHGILEDTIRRDWNSPSVMIWFLGNECAFPLDFLKDGKARCDRLDPIHRLISVAHTYGKFPDVKNLFDEAGLDFYDWHAYEYSKDKFLKLPESFGPSKPLTFSEWGWESAPNNDLFYERSMDTLLDQVNAGKVAGYMFFDWNDYPEFTREDWATVGCGTLISGVVTEAREIREPIYSRLAGLFAGRKELLETPPAKRPNILPLRSIPFSPGARFEAVNLQWIVESPSGLQAWTGFESAMEKYWPTVVFAHKQWQRSGGKFLLWQEPEFVLAGATFRSALVDNCVRPVLLSSDNPEINIPIAQNCNALHILGQVTLPSGYPIAGRHGEEVAVYSLQYASGKTHELPVRNGIEVAQANRIYLASRVTPIATAAQPALEFVKDIVREQYQILLWSIPLDSGDKLTGLHCKINSQQPTLAIFAITAELPAKR